MSEDEHLNSTAGSDPHLPNEILEKILSFLPTTTLLRKCRLVDKKWKTLASRLCLQRRSVSLRVSELFPIRPYSESQILGLCRDMEDAPWSSCEIILKVHKPRPRVFYEVTGMVEPEPEPPSQYSTYLLILEAVGSRLRELRLVVDEYQLVMANLSKVPNLEKLVISVVEPNSGGLIRPLPELENDPNFQLLKMKTVEIKTSKDRRRDERSSIWFDCLQLIIRKSPKLTNVSLSAKFISYDLEKLAPLLATIPSIALEFNYSSSSRDSLDFLTIGGCKNATNFKVAIQMEGGVRNVGLYHPLERFLLLNCDVMKKLSICFEGTIGSHSPPPIINIPGMSSLKVLQFGKSQELDDYCRERREIIFQFGWFVPFTTNHFPVLEELDCDLHDSTYDLFKDLNMESLKKLRLQPTSYDITTERDWASLCPKLEELEAHVNEPSLIYIMEKMSQLTKLCVSIYVNPPSRTINSILSGIQNPGRAYKESRENIQKLRESSGYPSLLNLNKLRHLEIHFPRGGTKLLDSGVYLSLLQMQSLEYLFFNSTQISQECETAIREYHHHYTSGYGKPPKRPSPKRLKFRMGMGYEFPGEEINDLSILLIFFIIFISTSVLSNNYITSHNQ